MRDAIVGILGLIIFILCWRKFGFKKALLWTCLIIMSIFPFAFTGMLLPSIYKFFGGEPLSMNAQVIAGIVVVVVATITAKYTGWGRVLAGMFYAVMATSYFVLLGFFLFCLLLALASGAR